MRRIFSIIPFSGREIGAAIIILHSYAQADDCFTVFLPFRDKINKIIDFNPSTRWINIDWNGAPVNCIAAIWPVVISDLILIPILSYQSVAQVGSTADCLNYI